MKKNILIILADQLRRQALGCYGDVNARTPHLDKLAERSVRLSAASSTYPICVPFRFTFMTGEYAHTRRVPALGWAMSPAERTLADEFNEGGYETIWVGKWHLDGGLSPNAAVIQTGLTSVKPQAQGRWQKWFGFEARNDPYDTYYFLDDDPRPRKLEGYQTDGLFDLGMNYLADRDRSKPFCMCLSVEPPHEPFIAPKELQDKWDKQDISLPPSFSAKSGEQKNYFIERRKRYYAMIENLDSNVGRVVEFLETNGLAEDTIVVFLADHGLEIGEHGHLDKRRPYEGSIGIPLIVFDPSAGNRADTIIDDPTCSEDLFPTFLGLTGLTPRPDLPGLDLVPLIKGEIAALNREGVLLEFVLEHRKNEPFHLVTWRGVRTKRYKYTLKGDHIKNQVWHFFDLQEDPHELNNLAKSKEHRLEMKRHHQLLCDLIKETGDHFPVVPMLGCEGVNHWQQYWKE